jgi:REP element-mobilizing transposase RayT
MLVRHRTDSPWQPGQCPRDRGTHKKAPALKARFTSGPFRSIVGIMPQSLSKVILHIIFSTKNRESWLESHVRPRVRAYLATVCRDLGAELVRVGGVAGHVHIVTMLPRTLSQADLVEQIKKTFLKSMPSAPPPLPASGERIEVRGIRKLFSEEALTVRINRRGSRSSAAKEGD